MHAPFAALVQSNERKTCRKVHLIAVSSRSQLLILKRSNCGVIRLELSQLTDPHPIAWWIALQCRIKFGCASTNCLNGASIGKK